MAGGSDWILEGKRDGYTSWTTGSEEEGTLKHWRRKEVIYEIIRQLPDYAADIGEGELGAVSGVIVFRLSPSRVSARSLTGASKFVCEADELEPIEKPTGFQQRRQVWKWVGPDVEYDPDTGADL